MRGPYLLITIVLGLGLCGSAWLTLHADNQHTDVHIATSRADIDVGASDGTVTLIASQGAPDGFSILADGDRPALPFRLVNVMIPAGRAVESFDATASNSTIIANDAAVKNATWPKPSPDDPQPVSAPDTRTPLAPYDGGSTFPSEHARYLGSGTLHGYTIASFAVFPVRVEDSRVVLYQDVSLRVTTKATNGEPALRPKRGTAATVASIQDQVNREVVNPQEASSYAPITVSDQRGPFQPSGVPSLEGSPVDYVIITTESMAAAFDSLAIWRTAKGVPTVVKTVEWIEANYRRGTDRAETVRYFIQDAYAKWGIKWVLLAGDTQEIPARYLYSTYYYGGNYVPSDLYFAGLDGDWNADHDTRFGESGVDAPDLYAEVFIGRLPVSTVNAAETVIRKIKRYETPINTAYTNKVAFLAEVLFPAPWSPPQTILQNGADIANYLNTLYVQSPGRSVTRMYETEWLFAGSVHLSRQTGIDSLTAGYNQVFQIGHGFRFNMHLGDDNLAIPDADALYHPDEYFNLYMLNCTATAFDYDCLAEHLLRNSHGGAISVLGATNSAFVDASAYYMEDYVEQLYTFGETHVGKTFTQGRINRTPYALLGDNVELWTHYIYNILADPEMSMWTTTPKTPVVSHMSSVPAGPNTIQVQVLVDGLPATNATVCCWKAGEDYQASLVNGSGIAAFSFTTPTAGKIRVVATAPNMKRYEGTINVTAPAGAMPVIESIAVDDDNIGGTSGNGDGVIDVGEVVDLTPSIRNEGAVTAPTLTATLSVLSSGVTIQDATAAVPSSAAGALVVATDPWRITVASSVTDEATINFSALLNNGGSNWTRKFSRVMHAPVLEITGLRKSDELPVGNGDGMITNGEQFLLFATLKNFGTGRADGLTAVLRSLDPGSTVIDSLSSYVSLDHLASAENTVGFKLSEADVLLSNMLEIEVTDAFGRTLIHPLELREPLPPTIQTFDASLGVDKMGITWTPGGSTDVRGYNIYRSLTEFGVYTRANDDVIAHTIFTDAGLAPSTRYYYELASVDSSGNESALSAAASASTNPPQLTGWPNELVNPSSNSAVIGDIDGYGNPEVVVGNDKLYAWHGDGQEVIDGDQQGITWGVISDQGDDFIGPAALGNLDGQPGFEIAAAAWTSKEVYCFNGDGTVMPGWPQPTIDQVRAGVVIGDIDGNSTPEIIAVDQDAYLYAWHVDGTEVIDGDSDPGTYGVFKRLPVTTQWQYQMPALADLDNDNKEEIIIATQDMKVYVLNELGGDEPGWPFSLPNYAGGGVAVGDIDNDGDLEIAVTTRNSGEIYALHHDGTQLWLTWINTNLFFNPSPALADITGDGKLETIIPASNGRLYAIQYDGSYAPGWPIYYSTKTYTESSPIIADVNGDGLVDILLGDEDRFINAWSNTGVPLDGFPLVTQDAVRGTPTVTDLDGDGNIDIVAVGYDKTVYAWQLNAPYNPNTAPWPTYRANVRHNGTYGVTVASGVNNPPARVFKNRLDQNYPNPFNPSTRIAFEVANGTTGNVTLTIYDVSGARVRTLVDEPRRPGMYMAEWDGRNSRGESVASGVYFYRLATQTGVLTRKMVLLK